MDLRIWILIFSQKPDFNVLFQVKSRVKRQGLWGGSQQWWMREPQIHTSDLWIRIRIWILLFSQKPDFNVLLFQVKSRVKRQGLWGGSQQWRMPQQSHRPQARASRIFMSRVSSLKGIVSREMDLAFDDMDG
jgi:hypothetical protein